MTSVGPTLCVLVDVGDDIFWSYPLHTRGCWGCQVLVLPSAYLWMLGMTGVGPTLCVLVDVGDAKCWSYPLRTRGCWG